MNALPEPPTLDEKDRAIIEMHEEIADLRKRLSLADHMMVATESAMLRYKAALDRIERCAYTALKRKRPK